MSLLPTAQRAIEAYGGADRWLAAERVCATVSTGGLAFRARRWPPLAGIAVEIDTEKPRVVFRREPTADPFAEYLADRMATFEPLPVPREELRFVGCALWNYLCFPRLLLRPDITWSEPRAGTLRARMPEAIPTHCARQTFVFEKSGLLKRHDYTAMSFGRWARAANQVLEHGTSAGLRFDARRRVTPRLGGRALPGPTLVYLEVSEWRLE